ncbi:MAG: FecCD family ABC transporter permease [Christensenellales bacterium]
MKTWSKALLLGALSLAVLLAAIGIGSVSIAPGDIFAIFGHKLWGLPLPDGMDAVTASILWDIRLPRALAAFLVGGALAASGTVMQSVLKNPLASSYTLGVSSGASLGAAAVMVTGFTLPFAGMFTLPIAGFIAGLATVLAAIAFAMRLDRNLENQTIILVGMVFSLFVNAILTLINALAKEQLQQLVLWQMGSFSAKNWSHLAVLLPVVLVGALLLCRYTREMDIMTFGDEQARAMGVDTKPVKLKLIVLAALLTGTAVSFTGVIGFVDLIAPHVVRRFFGAAHRRVLPLSVLFGGAFMAGADLVARTALSPIELPVGAVTALVGAPFFAFIYFKRRGRARA